MLDWLHRFRWCRNEAVTGLLVWCGGGGIGLVLDFVGVVGRGIKNKNVKNSC